MKRFLPLAALVLLGATPAFAEQRTPPTAEQVLAKVDQRLDRIGASEQQRETIHGLVEGAFEQREAFRDEARSIRGSMHDLLWAEDIDQKGLERLRKDGVDLFDRMTEFGLNHMISVAQVLTPEQRVAVHDLAAE